MNTKNALNQLLGTVLTLAIVAALLWYVFKKFTNLFPSGKETANKITGTNSEKPEAQKIKDEILNDKTPIAKNLTNHDVISRVDILNDLLNGWWIGAIFSDGNKVIQQLVTVSKEDLLAIEKLYNKSYETTLVQRLTSVLMGEQEKRALNEFRRWGITPEGR